MLTASRKRCPFDGPEPAGCSVSHRVYNAFFSISIRGYTVFRIVAVVMVVMVCVYVIILSLLYSVVPSKSHKSELVFDYV